MRAISRRLLRKRTFVPEHLNSTILTLHCRRSLDDSLPGQFARTASRAILLKVPRFGRENRPTVIDAERIPADRGAKS